MAGRPRPARIDRKSFVLASIMSDVFGVSGMLMLPALVDGKAIPETMAQLAKGLLRKRTADLTPLDARIDEALRPYHEPCRLLQQIPGVNRVVAAVLVAELGPDMRVFPSAKHLAAWAGVCPGNNESAGEQKATRARKGSVHLRTALVEAAVAASRKKGSYLKDKFHRLRARRGTTRATIAIAHKIFIAAYHMLSTGYEVKLGTTAA